MTRKNFPANDRRNSQKKIPSRKFIQNTLTKSDAEMVFLAVVHEVLGETTIIEITGSHETGKTK